MNVIVTVATCLLGMVGICSAVGLGGGCNDATTCTSSGQTCQRLYDNCDYYGRCGWEQKNNNDACVNSAQCLDGAECTNSVCKCASGIEYNTVLKRCTNKKELGQTCTTNPECYLGGISAECSGDSKVCKCTSGYIKDSRTQDCRPPYPTEAGCNTAIGCSSPRVIGLGIVRATCTSGSCTCQSGSTAKTFYQNGIAYKDCFTDVDMGADGAACATHNQCNTLFCSACPGTTTRTCIVLNGAGKPIAGLVVWIVMTSLLRVAL